FSPRQIEAVEANDFEHLPGVAFVRGMMRGYARMLEMDPAPVLAGFERYNMPVPDRVEPPAEAVPFRVEGKRVKGTNPAYSIVSWIIGVVGELFIYEWRFGLPRFGTETTDSSSAPDQASAPAVPAAPAPVASQETTPPAADTASPQTQGSATPPSTATAPAPS